MAYEMYHQEASPITIYFNVQIAPELASGSPFKLTTEFFFFMFISDMRSNV